MVKSYDELRLDFIKYHKENPHIWQLLKRFAFEAKNAGVTKIGISLLIERIRWEVQVVVKSKDGYKINNNHRAFYARRLMRKFPELASLFEIRKQRKKKRV